MLKGVNKQVLEIIETQNGFKKVAFNFEMLLESGATANA